MESKEEIFSVELTIMHVILEAVHVTCGDLTGYISSIISHGLDDLFVFKS